RTPRRRPGSESKSENEPLSCAWAPSANRCRRLPRRPAFAPGERDSDLVVELRLVYPRIRLRRVGLGQRIMDFWRIDRLEGALGEWTGREEYGVVAQPGDAERACNLC